MIYTDENWKPPVTYCEPNKVEVQRMNNEVSNRLIGRRIEVADVNGYGITIRFTDGSIFSYASSDGGYSSYDVYETEEEYLAEE